MNSKGGRRARRPATVPGRRPRPSGHNKSHGRAKLSGSLYLSNDGKSKFYPDGGREQAKFPPGVERPGRKAHPFPRAGSPERPGMTLPASPVRYYNNSFYTNDPKFDMEKSDDDSNYGSEAPPTPQQAIMRTYLTYFAIGFLVVVVFVAAIIVPLAILAGGNSTGPTVTGYVSIRTGFTSVLDDISSAQYINLKADFESAMNQIFQDGANYANDFKQSTVTDFAASVTATTTKVDFSVVFNSGVDITRIFRNSVFAFITEETRKSGSPFAPLDVVPSTLVITDSCGIFCESGGILSVISCTCTCLTGFNGTLCTIII